MLNFVICNANILFSQNLEYIINDFMKGKFTPYNVSSINKNFIVCENIAKNCSNIINVYVIDMSLDIQINGIELATIIRKYDYFAYIILVTDHNRFSAKIFQRNLKVLDYIQKSDIDFNDRLINCIDTIITETKLLFDRYLLNNNLLIKSHNNLYNINENNIIYIETNVASKKLLLHTPNSTFPFKGTLEKCESALQDNFIRSHRAYIINKNHIKQINLNKMTILMSNGDTCLLSTRKLPIFKKLSL